MPARTSTLTALLLTLVSATTAAAATQPAIPIPGPLDGPLTPYSGAPAKARPLAASTLTPNPALAPDGRSGSGLAAGNGGASPLPGPLGMATASESALQFGTCATLALAANDRLLALCNGPLAPSLRLIDPGSLATIASLTLPQRPSLDRTDLAGGTHFIVRRDGSLLLPTHAGSLLEIEVGANQLRTAGRVTLAGLLASGERPFAVGAGFDGHDWVVGNAGTVIAIPRDGSEPRSIALGEDVAEDLATAPSGTFVVTKQALYRLRLGPDGAPRVIWREEIARDPSAPSSGTTHEGSGTPPAIVPGGLVAVADDRDPARVGVYRIGGPSRGRLVCAVAPFRAGAGTVDSHLIVAGRSIAVANAHGYNGLATTELGGTSTGGMARILVRRRGCRTAWVSEEISPSAQPVVSEATGLLYTLVKPPGFPDAWNLAAIDWRSGKTRFAVLAGEGLGHNSEGGALILGGDGAAYAGSFAGVIRFTDR